MNRVRILSFVCLIFAANVFAQREAAYVKVLGIAQDAGYPQADCEKLCCQTVWRGDNASKLVSSLGLLEPKSKRAWLLDATPDLREQLHNLKERGDTLAGIFLTHAHIGHYTGLMHLGREVMGARKVPVYAMPRMKDFLENNGPWSQLVKLGNIDLRPLKNDSVIHLSEGLWIKPVLVPHRDEFSETVGFQMGGFGKSILFIPDIDKWSVWEKDIRQLIRKVDLAFLDGTFFANGEIPGREMSEIPHPFIMESLELMKDLSAKDKKKVHFIHFNHTNPVLDAHSEAFRLVKEKGFQVAEQGAIYFLE